VTEINQKMNQVLKVKINAFKGNTLTIDEKQLIKYTTLMQESELLRIVKHLNPKNKEPMSQKSNYPYIKDVIIIDVGDDTKLYTDSRGILTFNDDKYKRLIASTSNIRNSKAVMIKESLYDQVNEILLCGLFNDLEYDILAKFNSYYALCSTDSIPVSMPRIVIIDDYKHEIKEVFDLVKETAKGQFEVINNQNYKTEIIPFDGAGLVSIEFAKKWCEDLSINLSDDKEQNKKLNPACWQFRFIPCGKGNLYTFDIRKFAKEKSVTQITDLWGKTWELFDDEKNLLVDVILTKSQFKFHKLYSSYETWLNTFNAPTHGYKRTFNISGYSDAKHLNESVVLSYQPLQTLSFDNDEVKKLCYKTVEAYRKIRTDVDEFVKYRGLRDRIDPETGEIIQEERYIPPFYQALKENKDLFNDDYIQSKIKDDLKGFRNRSCKGMLFLNGSYQTLIPDLVALAQHAFSLPITGVLQANEIYNQFWHSRKVEKIALCRFPHIAREWKVANIIQPDYDDTKYLEYTNEGYVINIWDSTALRMGTADFDGDYIYGIAEGTILNALVKQESTTILHIPPEQNEEEKNKPKPMYPINNIEKLIETDCNGMKGGIGQCVNDITTLWSLPQTEERDNYIKIMSVIGAQIIDYAKTGVLAKTPSEVKGFLTKQNLPYFMRYKYPSKLKSEKRINRTKGIKGLDKIQKFNRNECSVNLICWYLEKQFEEIDKAASLVAQDSTNKKFHWEKLLKEKPGQYSKTYKKIKSMVKEFQNQHSGLSQVRMFKTKPEDINDNNYKYKIFYDYVRNSLLSLCRLNVSPDKILDYFLTICYTDEKYIDKAILWNCFPGEMLARIKGEYFFEREFDTKVLEFKAEKAKKKIERMKKSSELVKINLQADREIKDQDGKVVRTEKINIDATDIEVNVYQSEIDYIRKAKKISLDHKQMLLVLLVLNKLHKNNNAKFFICSGKKNKITPSHIAKLADIDFRNYEKIMTELYKGEYYQSSTGYTNLLIDINFMVYENKEGLVLTITDINEIKKYFKNILTKAS